MFKQLSINWFNHRLISVNVPRQVNQKILLKKSVQLAQRTMNAISDHNLLSPPDSIRGLKILDKTLFKKEIQVPALYLTNVTISRVMPILKKYILKMQNLKPVQINKQPADNETKENPDKYALLNPNFVKTWSDLNENDREIIERFGLTKEHFKIVNFTIEYENWRADELLRFILPEDKQSVAGFSKIGHVIHLNLREHVMEFKNIIGQILLDKITGVRTVVNKLDKIDNTFRNFEMERICGDEDMFVRVRENHCNFEFDFAQVYWNPRLSTEHERITNMLKTGDVLYDVFAGVGPFAIPAARKKCIVFANDLNPESFNWLNHNARINKINSTYLKTFNKDGREFIRNDLKIDLINRLKTNSESSEIHIAMNLPALAPEFLDSFTNLFENSDIDSCKIDKYPTIHVYCFAKGENPVNIARGLVERNLKLSLTDNLIEIFNVRKVSNNKEMMRVSFKLTREILFETLCNKRSTSQENLSTNVKKCV